MEGEEKAKKRKGRKRRERDGAGPLQWNYNSRDLLLKGFMPFGDSVVPPGWMVKSECNFSFSVVYVYVCGGVKTIKEKMLNGI